MNDSTSNVFISKEDKQQHRKKLGLAIGLPILAILLGVIGWLIYYFVTKSPSPKPTPCDIVCNYGGKCQDNKCVCPSTTILQNGNCVCAPNYVVIPGSDLCTYNQCTSAPKCKYGGICDPAKTTSTKLVCQCPPLTTIIDSTTGNCMCAPNYKPSSDQTTCVLEGCSPSCQEDAPICDKESNTCGVCTSQEQCDGSVFGNICDIKSGRCIGCTSEYCLQQGTYPICDKTLNKCVACNDDDENLKCPEGKKCKQGRCVDCITSADCVNSSYPICNLNGMCDKCVTSEQCQGLDKNGCGFCQVDGRCSKCDPSLQCSGDCCGYECLECTNGSQCPTTLCCKNNKCTKCMDDIDCESGSCNTRTGHCVPPCTSDLECINRGISKQCIDKQCKSCTNQAQCASKGKACLVGGDCGRCSDQIAEWKCMGDNYVCNPGTGLCNEISYDF